MMTDTERLAWDLYEGRIDSSFLREPLPDVNPDRVENRFAELVHVILKAEMLKWGEQFGHLSTAKRQTDDEAVEAKPAEPQRMSEYRTAAARLADEIEAKYR